MGSCLSSSPPVILEFLEKLMLTNAQFVIEYIDDYLNQYPKTSKSVKIQLKDLQIKALQHSSPSDEKATL